MSLTFYGLKQLLHFGGILSDKNLPTPLHSFAPVSQTLDSAFQKLPSLINFVRASSKCIFTEFLCGNQAVDKKGGTLVARNNLSGRQITAQRWNVFAAFSARISRRAWFIFRAAKNNYNTSYPTGNVFSVQVATYIKIYKSFENKKLSPVKEEFVQ